MHVGDLPDQRALVPGYTFESFCVGPASELAFLAARGVAERQGPAFNPLFLWGAAGVGKTHLLHAIGHRARQLHPESRVICRSVERFVNDMIDCITEGQMSTFRQVYRNLDLLLLDGLENLANKNRTQDELLHTLDELLQAQAQVVIASLWSPLAAPQFSDQLRGRCAGGLVIELKAPGEQELVEILARKAAYHEVHLADHLVQAIVRCVISGDVRAHEGALNRILAYSTLTGREVTEEVVRHLLGAELGEVALKTF